MTQKTLVIGLGLTGLSIVRYLKSVGSSFEVFDTRQEPPTLDAFKKNHLDIQVYTGTYPEERLGTIARIICSPGVSLESAVLKAAQAKGVVITSDIELFREACTAPILAVTGTNGKSTVVSLCGEMAKAVGLQVKVAGNIGTPVLDCLLDSKNVGLWVLELSSFQLEITHHLGALASAFLNLSDDHLDRHHDMVSYRAAKQRIYSGASAVVFNRDDLHTYPDESYLTQQTSIISYGEGEAQTPDDFGLFQDTSGHVWLTQGCERLIEAHQVSLPGKHNVSNALAALALMHAANIPLEPALQTLKQFSGLPHRCQVVRHLDDVMWINDSKGTNVGATQAAIEGLGPALEGHLILIAGGQGKGANFSVLRDAVKRYVDTLILIGEDAAILEAALKDVARIIPAGSMEEAVLLAQKEAKPKDAVLLSPACASFDWFRDFNHRGDVFTGLVEAL